MQTPDILPQSNEADFAQWEAELDQTSIPQAEPFGVEMMVQVKPDSALGELACMTAAGPIDASPPGGDKPVPQPTPQPTPTPARGK